MAERRGVQNCPHGRLWHADCDSEGPWREGRQARIHHLLVVRLLEKQAQYWRDVVGEEKWEEALQYWRERFAVDRD